MAAVFGLVRRTFAASKVITLDIELYFLKETNKSIAYKTQLNAVS